MTSSLPMAQFAPFLSVVSPSFWNTLSHLKLNEYQLNDELIPVRADYSPIRAIVDRTTGTLLGAGCRIRLGSEGLDVLESGASSKSQAQTAITMCGYVKNFNTMQEFKAADKPAYFYQIAEEIWRRLLEDETDDPNEFLLLTYADLKDYKYYYWFAFPALLTKAPGWQMEPYQDALWTPATAMLGHDTYARIGEILAQHGPISACFVDVRTPLKKYALRDGMAFCEKVPEDSRFLVFVDPSQHEQVPGWPLRNILTYVYVRFGLGRIRVVCWKDPIGESVSAPRSMTGTMVLNTMTHAPSETVSWQGRDTYLVPRPHMPTVPDAVGWERNSQGRLVPKMVALGEMLDPYYLADRAVDLNLKLMRWRVVPDLALETIQSAETLLIGAGTLGCYVARSLLGWGIRHITLVDNGHVSYSNPVRQPLFEFTDCLDGGRPKAEAAAEALRRVFPGAKTQGVNLAVPMPGHPIPAAHRAKTVEAIRTLETLVRQHDIIYLLTDSRESRWLPTMLGAAHNKLVINAALGYDSYLVMRHGVQSVDRLGCYFCSDVVAPSDSLTDRTLDQMCTVTRPGLAAIAAATAVELMASLLQHPLAAQAPAMSEQDDMPSLGMVPHQIRGYLARFQTMTLSSRAFHQCTACAPDIVAAYEQDGVDFVCAVCDDPAILEHISHLDELKADVDTKEIDLDWSSDED